MSDFFIFAALPSCSSDPITVSWDNGVSDGVSFSSSSTSDYVLTGSSIPGCESTDTVTIYVAPSGNADTTVSIACDSLVWQANTYTTSGMYHDTLQTVMAVIVY